MPYKINSRGKEAIGQFGFTEKQDQSLKYLNKHSQQYVGAREVALHYGYPNGQYFRGVLASLHEKGLIDKIGE